MTQDQINNMVQQGREAHAAFQKCAGTDHQTPPAEHYDYDGEPWTNGQIIITLLIILFVVGLLSGRVPSLGK